MPTHMQKSSIIPQFIPGVPDYTHINGLNHIDVSMYTYPFIIT